MRLLAPLGRSDVDKTKRVADFFEIRSIDDAYARVMIVDRLHLMQFREIPSDSREGSARFQNMFYTNDPKYTVGMYRMLSNMWARCKRIEDL